MYRDVGRDEARSMFETDLDAPLPVVLRTLHAVSTVCLLGAALSKAMHAALVGTVLSLWAARAVLQLSQLFGPATLRTIVDYAASNGGREQSEEDVDVVRGVLHSHIEEQLARCGLRPQWKATFAELISILS